MAVKKVILTGTSGRIGRTCFKAMGPTCDFSLTDLNRPDQGISSLITFQAGLLKRGTAETLLVALKLRRLPLPAIALSLPAVPGRLKIIR